MTEIENLHHRFCQYSLAFKGNTPSTISWFEENNGYFFKTIGIESPEQITKDAIEHWICQGKIQRSWSAKTIKNRLQALSCFADWLVRQNYLRDNPVKDIPKPKIPKRIPGHLKKDEAMTLIDWARNFRYAYKFERTRAVAIIATFIFTGVRLQELKNLKVVDVNLQASALTVKAGKGDKDRIIPLNPQLNSILQNYLKDRDRLKKTCPYFFTSMRTNDRMGDLVIKRLVEKLRQASGIYFYPHLLRHTFATLMLEGGCDIFSLSKMMGHSDIKTTTIYLSATTAHLQEQILKHPLQL